MAAAPRKDRRRIRAPLKVIHRHRIGDQEPFERESELVFVRERAVAILEWIDIGGVRTPLFICPLDREKLRPVAPGRAKTFYYDDVTVDPRDS
jgi:hypothetical protein